MSFLPWRADRRVGYTGHYPLDAAVSTTVHRGKPAVIAAASSHSAGHPDAVVEAASIPSESDSTGAHTPPFSENPFRRIVKHHRSPAFHLDSPSV